MFDIGTLHGVLILDDRFTPVLTAAASKLDLAAANMQRVGRRFEEAGRILTFGVTAPLTAAAAAAVTMANNFESTITKLATISNVGVAELEMMRKAALELAPVVGQGPQALADALIVITSTGLDAKTSLEVLERSAKAAAIGLGTTKDIARSVTSAIIAYGEENLSAAEATDILLAAVRAGGAEADEVAESLGRVIGIAATVGVSFQELTTYIATFTRLGIDADEAVTALRGTLNALSLKSSPQAREALKAIGFTMDELRASLREKGLTETMIALVKAAEGNADAMGKMIPNVRALAGVLGTAGVQAENLRDILKQTQGSAGDLDRAFELASKTGAFKWSQVVARLKTEMIELGDAFVRSGVLDSTIKVIDRLLDALSAAVEGFGKLSKPVQEFVLTLGFIAVAAGPVIRIVGSMTRLIGYLTEAVSFLVESLGVRSLIGIITRVASLLTTFALESETVGSVVFALANGPVAAIVAGLGLFTGALRLISGSWDFLIEPAKAAWSILQDVALIMYDLTSIGLANLSESIQDVGGWVKDFWKDLKGLFNAVVAIVDPFNLWAVALGLVRAQLEWMIKNAKIAAAVVDSIATATGMASGRIKPEIQGPVFDPSQLTYDWQGPRRIPGVKPPPGGPGGFIPDPKDLKAAARAAEELQKAYDRINSITVTLTDSQRENISWFLKRKVAESDIQKVMGVTAEQIKLVVEEERFLIDIRKTADEQAKAHWQGQLKMAQDLTKGILTNLNIRLRAEEEADRMRRESTLDFYEFQRSEIDAWQREEMAKVDRSSAGWGRALDAIEELAQLKYDAAADAASIASMRMATDAVKVEDAWVDVFANLPKLIQDAFTGGGGLSGAIDAFVSQAGSVLGRAFARSDIGVAIFGGIANAIGKIGGKGRGNAFASIAPDISAAIGSLAGPAIDKFLGDGILGTSANWALTGAMIAGPWGAAIGAIAGAIAGGIKKFENTTKKSREEFAQSMGLSLGGLYNDLNKLGKAGQELAHIGLNIVGRKDEAANKKWMADVTAFYENLEKQVEEVLNRTDVLWTQQMVKFAQNTPVFGEMIKKQLSSAAAGLTSFLTAGANAAKAIADIRKEMEDLDETDEKWADLNKTLKEQQGIWDVLGIKSQQAASAFGASIAGIFTLALDKGRSILDIVAELTPAVDAFRKQLEITGLSGGAAFDAISGLFTIASDKVAGPALQAVNDLGQALIGLSNTGLLNEDIFKGLGGQITQAFSSLVDLGFDGNEVMRLMQPTLQTLWELQEDFGYAVDDATQKLLAEAEASGIVGDKFRDPMERMIKAMETVVSILERIAIKMGALPEVAGSVARDINDELGNIREPNIRIKFSYDDIRLPFVDADEAPGYATGTGGRFLASGGLARLHANEAVVPRSGVGNLAAEIAAMMPTASNINVYIDAVDGASVMRIVRTREFAEEFNRQIKNNTNAMGSTIAEVVG